MARGEGKPGCEPAEEADIDGFSAIKAGSAARPHRKEAVMAQGNAKEFAGEPKEGLLKLAVPGHHCPSPLHFRAGLGGCATRVIAGCLLAETVPILGPG